MTKSKKIFTVLSCLMLLAIMSVSILMVGCQGEDTTTIVIGANQVKEFVVGKSQKDYAWDVTFTPGYVVEMYVNETDTTKTEIGPGKTATSVAMKTYNHLVKNNFSISGFDTSTATQVAATGETEVLNVHYRVCTITYLGKQASFKYKVNAAA